MICPPNIRGQVFITVIVDSIDHYPLPTRATEISFHGRSISLIRHPSNTEEGHDMEQIILRESSSSKKCINPLTARYTNIRSVVSKSDKVSLPKDQSKSPRWSVTAEAISKSMFHAERQMQVAPKSKSSLLHFLDCAHSEAMISYAITVIDKVRIRQSGTNCGYCLRSATLCFSENN